MTHPSLFADLPDALADAMRELHLPDPPLRYVGDALAQDLEKVGRIFSDVAFPMEFPCVVAEALTPLQRQVAVALTELDLPSPLRSDFPQGRAVRRRWLGLDPKGPLEQTVTFTLDDVTREEPIWRWVKLIHSKWNQLPGDAYLALRARFDAQFSIEERLRMWGEVNSTYPAVWGLPNMAFFNWGEQPELFDQLHGEGAAWARAYLDSVLADTSKNFRDLLPPFMAFVRGGVAIETRWDAIMPLHIRYAGEFLRALPESRREVSALASLNRGHPANALRVIIEVLPVLPSAALLELALSCIPKSVGSPRKHRRALREAAGAHPELLALLDAADAEAGPPLVLTTTCERSIASEGADAVFSELDKSQLLVAGKRYLGGKGAPIEVLLALNPTGPAEERSLRAQLFYRAIADAKDKHTYDAWLYQTDSGIVFKAGTTRVAAEVVQFSVSCKDDRLAEALEETLRAAPSVLAASPKKVAGKTRTAKRP